MRRLGLRRRSDGGYRDASMAATSIRLPSGNGVPHCHIHNSYLETAIPRGACSVGGIRGSGDCYEQQIPPLGMGRSQFLDIFVAEWRDDSTRRTVAHE